MSALRAPVPARPSLPHAGDERAGSGAPAEEGDVGRPAEPLVGTSPVMQALFKRIALVAPTGASVLVTGEPGTEIEAVARAIHAHSPRRAKPLVVVRGATSGPDCVERLLFGDATGSDRRHDGLLVGTEGGTVFLDELATIPLAAQARLLGAIEWREVTPVGGVAARQVDVRLIAATSEPTAALRAGRLRRDLVDRLAVYPVPVPPLRDRVDDIPVLADGILRNLGIANPAGVLPADTLAALAARPWPGNVRELRDVLAHAIPRAGSGAIRVDHLPPGARSCGVSDRLRALVVEWVRERVAGCEAGPTDLDRELRAVVEPALLGEVLRQLGGRRLPAARWLGLSRTTVRKMVREHVRPGAGPDV